MGFRFIWNVKWLYSLSFVGALAATNSHPIPNGTRIVLPAGTPVTVVVTNQISSATAKVGDTFQITAKKAVIVGGWVAIEKGAPGQGEILAVTRAGSHGKPGSLGIQMDWIYAADGEKVKLGNQSSTQEGEGKTGVASTMTILSYALLGPLGLFTHNFVKGKDVVVDDTHPLQTYISDSVYVIATTRAISADSGFATKVNTTGNAPKAPTAVSSPGPKASP
ncbi:MAG: hypothetical protein WBW76_15830 [Candidatus Cybelea sp.]